MSSNILCGFAETDITPDTTENIMLVGFPRPDNRARGILHRLAAQVLLFREKEGYTCLIAIDSIGFTTELTMQLRERIGVLLGETAEKIMVCFSHTHAAPDAAYRNAAYFHFACGRILEAVKRAQNELFPAKADGELRKIPLASAGGQTAIWQISA